VDALDRPGEQKEGIQAAGEAAGADWVAGEEMEVAVAMGVAVTSAVAEAFEVTC